MIIPSKLLSLVVGRFERSRFKITVGTVGIVMTLIYSLKLMMFVDPMSLTKLRIDIVVK